MKLAIELEPQGIMRLPDWRGARVSCLEGALWITTDNDPNDVVLEPGAAYLVAGNATLVQAVRASRIRIEPPSEKKARLPFATFSELFKGSWT